VKLIPHRRAELTASNAYDHDGKQPATTRNALWKDLLPALAAMTLAGYRLAIGQRNPTTGRILLLALALLIAGVMETQMRLRKASARTKIRLRVLLVLVALAGTIHMQVRWRAVDGPTGFLFLLLACLIIAVIVEAGLSLLKASAALRTNVRVLLVTTTLLLFGVELFLRFGLARHATYSESNHGRYASIYRPGHGAWFHVYPALKSVELRKTEFTHFRTINSLGLTGPEPVLAKARGEYRILALGDSFTEGVGAPADSTWARVVERALSARHPGRRITTLNGGVNGSDPCFDYLLLREKLLPYRPDLVIETMNTSDVGDILIRGGMERFRSDGTLSYRAPPKWEWLYSLSFIVRHVVHDVLGYNWFLIKKSRERPEAEKAVETLKSSTAALHALCTEHGIHLMIVTHPLENEVRQGRYAYDAFSWWVADLEKDGRLPFQDLLRDYAARGTITTATARRFYWPIDLHHNAAGYEVMGEAIARRINEMNLVATAEAF
jgi:lysophospholipase L1-like esterase